MKQVLDFLADSKLYFLATTEGDQPRLRPMGFFMEWEGKLAFCTSNQKKMYRQLIANPKVELSSVDGERNTLRICGRAVPATTAASQQKALETMPALSGMYAVGDGKFEIFCLEDAKAVCISMRGEIQDLEL